MKTGLEFERLARQQAVELDRTGGRCQIIEGHVFYSPNSKRDVSLPPPPTQPSILRCTQRLYPAAQVVPEKDETAYRVLDRPAPILRNPATEDVSEFRQPQWWTREYCHLSFIPLESIHTGLLNKVFSTPSYPARGRQGYSLDPKTILDWNHLEYDLRHVIKMLFERAHIRDIPQMFHTALVCTGTYADVAPFHQAVSRSKEWFQYWIGMLSYAIAASMTCDEIKDHGRLDYHSNFLDTTPNSTYIVPGWYSYLAGSSWHEMYLWSVHSAAGNFDPSIPRVGIFLTVLNPVPEQFSVDWFCKFNIPVWYPWGAAEIAAALSNASLSRFSPLPHQLQLLASSSVPRTLSSNPWEFLPYKTLEDIREYTSWRSFFREREERNRKLLEHMSPDACRSYSSRMLQPPSKSCRVYVWVKNESTYCRVGVAKISFEDVWEDYAKHQRIYDALENSWDCCKEFSGHDLDELNHNYDSYPVDSHDRGSEAVPASPCSFSGNLCQSSPISPYRGMPGSSPQSPDPSIAPDKSFDCPSSPYLTIPPADPILRTSDKPLLGLSSLICSFPVGCCPILDPIGERYEAVHILHEYFGFVPPLPLIPKPGASLPTPADKIRFHAVLGMGGQPDNAFFDSPYGNYAIDFLKCLDISPARLRSGDLVPSSDLWDLALNNRMYIGLRSRLRVLRRISDSLLVFNFGEDATVSWTLGVFDATAALLVCRLPEHFNDYNLAFSLLQRGIPFATLEQCSGRVLRSPPVQILPIRLSHATFSRDDYDVYVRERDTLLSNPRIARAGLLKGGIIWRLIGQTCQFATALLGPTAAATFGRVGLLYTDGRNQAFYDDIISESEMDTLCGTVVCMTGSGTVCQLRSWWPRYSTWVAAVSHPHWSGTYENLFQRRSKDLAEGKAKPLTAKEWKQLIRLSSSTRRVCSNVTFHSEAFLVN